MSRSTLLCALGAGALAALAVADSPVGLGATLTLLALLATAVLARSGRPPWLLVALGGGLALQPLLRDATWVQQLATLGVLLTAGSVAVPGVSWPAVRAGALAPLRLAGGARLMARSVGAAVPRTQASQAWAVARGVLVAGAVVAAFGALLVSADQRFSALAGGVFDVELVPDTLLWRAVLGLFAAAVAGALAHGAAAPPAAAAPGWVPGRTELRIVLAALAALFAAFVAVRLRVLFGGADYVQATTGLGYGEYARQGFAQLVVAALLVLALVGVAARREDAVAHALLGALCGLVLVVLASAFQRLVLVEQAYGLTQERLLAHAAVVWLTGLFLLVLAAGARATVAVHAPRAAVLWTLTGLLAFTLANPDARIAESAAAQVDEGRELGEGHLYAMSADALPALRALPPSPGRTRVLAEVEHRLTTPDGLTGLNLSRLRAR